MGRPPKKEINLSKESILSLDLFDLENEKNQSLFSCLNKCRTSMGKRKLKEWIASPLKEKKEIEGRHNVVESFIKNEIFLKELSAVYDLARLIRRAAIMTLLPHEIYFLYDSLLVLKEMSLKYKILPEEEISSVLDYISGHINVYSREMSLNPKFFLSLPAEMRELSLKIERNRARLEDIKDELQAALSTDKLRFSEKLDSLKLIGPKSLHEKATALNIRSVKKASDAEFFPNNFSELATSVVSDRNLFEAKSQSLWDLFQANISEKFSNTIYLLSEEVAEFDVLSTFALLSKDRGYTRPIIVEYQQEINLKAVRHPIVESSNLLTETYIANDLHLSDSEKKTLVLYGPNSSGKSTFIKSIGLCVIMNQIGCFIPANEGSSISLFDGVFTRASSSDNLSEGLSTFVVEMKELNSALLKSDKRCLYILDEVGRGTDSSDGEGLAFGTIKFLDNENKNCLTLFATHYHGLYEKIKEIKSVVVKNVSCLCSDDGELIYFRNLSDGPGEGSYGIEVAKSCGLPNEIILIAKNYKKENFSFKKSRYNSKLEATTCELCNNNPARETHHIVEQRQGKVKSFSSNGKQKSINDISNLVFLCSNCHEKITRNEIIIIRKVKTSSGFKLETKNQ